MNTPIANKPAIPRPVDEARRLAALHRYELLDTDAEADFDFLTGLAARLCDAPHASISLVDHDRVWLKSCFGESAGVRSRDDDCCSWAILEPEFLCIPDLSTDARSATLSSTVGPPGYRMFAGANLLTADGLQIGMLCVMDHRARAIDQQQSALLAHLARQAMALIELRAGQRELAHALATIERLATIDDLTGLLNRPLLLEKLDVEVERAHRFGLPLSVVRMDIDHFKAINDAHGHAVGDDVLRNVGRIIRDELRQVDVAGRYGGEEFCIVLPGTSRAGSITLADALRQEIEHYVHVHANRSLSATASFGLASLDARAGDDATTLLKAADDALSRAKRGGRNRVEVASRGADG